MSRVLLAILTLGAATAVHAQERLPPVAAATYDAAQQQAARDFEAKRHVPLSGPFLMLMRSPDLMTAARSMGDYLRYKSAIGNTLSEFVILITARAWSQDYEWTVHEPIAVKQGVAQTKIDAIADGRRPDAMSEDEAAAYDFVTELQRDRAVSDPTYVRALKRFGEKGVVDLAGIAGYYSLLSMEMNMARTDPGGPLRLKPLAR